MDVSKSKIDEMHAWFDVSSPPTQFTRSVTSIHFYLGLVIIEKSPVEAPELMMRGEGDLVHAPLDSVVHR